MSHVGLLRGDDPYLIHLFFHPQELQLFVRWPMFDPDNAEDTSTGVIWSNRDDWGIELGELSDKAEPLVADIVAILRDQTPSVHSVNDYPSLSWSSDDQLIISVHPLDRLEVWERLQSTLLRAGWSVVCLSSDPMGGQA